MAVLETTLFTNNTCWNRSFTAIEHGLMTMEMENSDQLSSLYFATTTLQRYAGILSIVVAFVASCVTIQWANSGRTGDNFLGGLNWDELVFNYHPVLMVSGMCFGFISAALSFRVIPAPKAYVKIIHALLHAATIICVITGLAAVVTSHNYTNHNGKGTYTANLYSNHSFMGLSALVMYFSNFIVGILYFLFPIFSEQVKRFARPNHMFVGVVALFVGTMAIESGLSELTAKQGCIYSVSSADWNPAENYHKLSDGCKTANGIGILVLLAVLLASYALIGPGVGVAGSVEKSSSSSSADDVHVISSSSPPLATGTDNSTAASVGTGINTGSESSNVRERTTSKNSTGSSDPSLLEKLNP